MRPPDRLTAGERDAIAYLEVISWHVEKAMPARIRLALASLAERGIIETRAGADAAGRRVRLPVRLAWPGLTGGGA